MLILDNLSKSFEQPGGNVKNLFRSINIEVKKGSIVSIIGPNGCGKSTLFKIISGELSADTGNIFLNFDDITYSPIHLRSKMIGYVQQDTYRSMASDLSVGHILSIAGKRKVNLSLSYPKVAHSINLIKNISPYISEWLENKIEIPTKFLSGGQRQLLAIISSVLGNPEVILLDEFTASLDDIHKSYADNLIHKITYDTGTITLCITHDHAWAKKNSDFILRFDNGKIELYNNEFHAN